MKRVLPADVYDTLELSAWVHGGIGADEIYAGQSPLCLLGHVDYCDPIGGEMERGFRAAFFPNTSLANPNTSLANMNDEAVEAINKRHGNAPYARVPFNKWCKELNVVRGT